MFAVNTFVILLLVYVANCEDGNLPSYITPCDFKSAKFIECIKEQFQNALPEFTKGNKELGVPSTDPVQLKNIDIIGNGLNLTFSNAAMYGLSKVKLTDLKAEFSKVEGIFSLSFKGNLSLKAQYVADGRILILPIQGHGPATINAQGVEVHIDSKLVHDKNSNGDHFKLAAPKFQYTIERTTFELENLFNGNKQLAETTTQFANENWKQLMDDLSPSAIKQIVRTVVKAINKFFSQVSINKMVKGYSD